MGLNGLSEGLSVMVHFYVLSCILGMVKKRCLWPVRGICMGLTGLILLLIGAEMGWGMLFAAFVSVAVLAGATAAYDYSGMDRIYTIAVGTGIIMMSYMMFCVWNTGNTSYFRNLMVMVAFEMVLYFVVRIFVEMDRVVVWKKLIAVVVLYVLGIVSVQRQIISGAVILILFILIVDFIMKANRNNQEKETLNRQMIYYKSELQAVSAYDESIRGLKHDMKNHLNMLAGLINDGKTSEALDYISSLQEIVQGKAGYVRTGNYEIDSIINSKMKIMEQSGITCQHRIMVPKYLDVAAADLVAVLGNLLDNAIRGVQLLGNLSAINPAINIKIIYDRGRLCINVNNVCDDDGSDNFYSSCDDIALPRFLKTTKEDGKNHGIGLGNVILAVKKYDGVLEIRKAEGVFDVSVEMCNLLH